MFVCPDTRHPRLTTDKHIMKLLLIHFHILYTVVAREVVIYLVEPNFYWMRRLADLGSGDAQKDNSGMQYQSDAVWKV